MGCGNSTPARGVSSRASSSAAPRASTPPAAPSPRRLPRRFAPPAPRRRGFALEFSAPSHHRSASSGSPDAARSFARATGSGAAASFAAALARSDDRHRPFPRGGERASTLEALRAALGAECSPSSRDVDVAAFERAVLSLRPPSRDPRFSDGDDEPPGTTDARRARIHALFRALSDDPRDRRLVPAARLVAGCHALVGRRPAVTRGEEEKEFITARAQRSPAAAGLASPRPRPAVPRVDRDARSESHTVQNRGIVRLLFAAFDETGDGGSLTKPECASMLDAAVAGAADALAAEYAAAAATTRPLGETRGVFDGEGETYAAREGGAGEGAGEGAAEGADANADAAPPLARLRIVAERRFGREHRTTPPGAGGVATTRSLAKRLADEAFATLDSEYRGRVGVDAFEAHAREHEFLSYWFGLRGEEEEADDRAWRSRDARETIA